MLHLGTINKGLQEFIVMLCTKGPERGKVYIEEAVLNAVDLTKDVFAYCKFISDDALAEDLARFAEMKKLTDMKRISNCLLDQGRQSWLMPTTGLRK